MILTLIGMSGTGKSYWSKKLATQGYIRFGCDDLIENHLAKKMNIADIPTFDIHQWVGYPDQESHTSHADQYLQAEAEVLHEIIESLNNSSPEKNIVIDSTGSIIYMQGHILDSLSRLTKVVYLDITPQDHDSMLNYYLSNPVAIIWNGFFEPLPHENRQQTFTRCYPKLIRSREQQYQQFAQITIPASFHRNPNTGTQDLLEFIQAYHHE